MEKIINSYVAEVRSVEGYAYYTTIYETEDGKLWITKGATQNLVEIDMLDIKVDSNG